LKKSKFFKKEKKLVVTVKLIIKQSYAQTVNSKITNSLKLKEDYPNLLAKKIKNIYKIINNSDKAKSQIKITTKGLLCKQTIVSMGKNNITKFMASSSNYVINLNRALKNIKSEVMVDYVYSEPISITIVTNKVALSSDLQVIKNYVKNVKNINSEDIKTSRLSQMKSYLKIIGISYFMENTNVLITSDFVESIIKVNHIFNNLLLTSKL